MQSTAFNSVVSPRGVKPRSTQSIPARVPQPRGGLTALKSVSPKLASKVVGVVPAAEDLIGGLQMAGGGKVLPPEAQARDFTPEEQQQRMWERIFRERPEFYPPNEAPPQQPEFYMDQPRRLGGNPNAEQPIYNGQQPETFNGYSYPTDQPMIPWLQPRGQISMAAGGLSQPTDNEPSYAEYMRNGAAPAGLDADQYQGDYQRYLQEMQRARQPARMASRIPPELAQERERNTSNLPLAVGAGAYGAATANAAMKSLVLAPGEMYETFGGHPPSWMPTSERMREWPSMVGIDTKSPLYNESFDIGNTITNLALTPQMLMQLYQLAKKAPAGLRTLRDLLTDETRGATGMGENTGFGKWQGQGQ